MSRWAQRGDAGRGSLATRRGTGARGAAPRQGVSGAGPSRTLTLDTGGQLEQITIGLQSESSSIYMSELSFPLGLVFEARGARVEVAEVAEGGAADAAGGRRSRAHSHVCQ